MPLSHKIIVCRLWCSFMYWHLLISYIPYKWWKSKINSRPSTSSDKAMFEIQQLVKLAESVGRHHLVKVNCLRRCMVQKTLLNRMGINTHLILGVKKQQKIFAAHCWLTHNNKIINDSESITNEYVVLQKIDSNTSNIFIHF
jgi:hypothetical protein